ncbi:DNA-3-methyladenine glycosylase I [Flavobacterium columnare NBRC 100251 = ATCC 23463]|uniref:DNA-3-methyladenine glycosylase I n=1 Tax=Flavobacterium columnare (strain ATCC 49512 / CIP 103533 / TG 44/87) TaxID=1041826 RepID=G8X9N3_FLACA|nr:DNA-3-methyladenine glycosylase I [Flavobacterium columnare]AEW86596.1 DNA-3-methyladenine glycosylase I [Flavobacterium columnare ATCC 49512]ANO47003.1 DNA-methyladenine glycosylase I [Flavobacterium columnare]APT22296.1 DNA-3-methyladenine glycosylase [Flavobacterium columnare]MBF6652706.1 DNA-3-methyladenine glycosylase I [Flavobacterium columnare]MBF6655658.1 DNA-3-methyladenine glycosylase I [Flavobacterium columnare]
MKKIRCNWCEKDDLYRNYHDNEWGTPVYDDETIFEFLVLETFQAGLSWYTILCKRENFRKAFNNFDFEKIAKYSQKKMELLAQDSGIIRHKLKIKATVTNAQAFIKIREEFGTFSEYIWGFVDGKPIDNTPQTLKDVPATTEISNKLSKDLKKRGFKFVGSTVVYAYMQAIGMVNDHIEDCWKRNN